MEHVREHAITIVMCSDCNILRHNHRPIRDGHDVPGVVRHRSKCDHRLQLQSRLCGGPNVWRTSRHVHTKLVDQWKLDPQRGRL